MLDGANLLAAADLVISGGGTMNREAAALWGADGNPDFAGRPAAVDEYLLREGRLLRIESSADLSKMELRKKTGLDVRDASGVRDQVVNFILNES